MNIQCDGGVTPGVGIYWSVAVTGRVVVDKAKSRKYKTNNEAEYVAFIAALKILKDSAPSEKTHLICSDSLLIVNQITGAYTVKSPNLLPLWMIAREKMEELGLMGHVIDIRWKPRTFIYNIFGH